MAKRLSPSRERGPADPDEHEADDAEIVARAHLDRRAFSPLYARYVDRVYRYCHRRLGTREAAEDATAAVFTNALAGLAGFRGGSFAAWLFAIAHNVCLNAGRRRPDLPLTAADDLPTHDLAAAPEAAALAAEERRTLHGLLAGLPPDQRRVVDLRLSGPTGAEIAEAMGRTLPSIKMLQARAFARMRAAYAAGSAAEEADGPA